MNINETIGAMYAEYFLSHTQEETFDFVFKTSLAVPILNSLYNKFVDEGIDVLEKIPQDKKQKYWDIACKYFKELPERLKASKAVYTLELITSTF